jgi:uncharacterized protein
MRSTRYVALRCLELIVNIVTEFRVSIFQQFLGDEIGATHSDLVVSHLIALIFEMKAFSLFSVLFGLGLAMQFERLSRNGRPYYFLGRRLVVLLFLGLSHLLFVWNGDILTEYALAGLIVLPLIGSSARTLAAISLSLFVFFVALPLLPLSLAWPDPTALKEHVTAANEVYAQGSYRQYVRFSIHELGLLLPLHVYIFPRTLALFCFGAFLWKAGLFRRLSERRLAFFVSATIGVSTGLILTTVGAPNTLGNLAPALRMLAPVVLAFGYGAGVVSLALLPAARGALRPFAAVGRMAFTNYVLQSLVFGAIFFGFGFGMFGKMGAAQAVLTGAVVYVLQALLSAYWLNRYQFGPLEWLWRSLMYGRQQPMRRLKAAKSTVADET